MRVCLFVAILAGTLIGASGAQAGGSNDVAATRFELGQKLYAVGRYAEAVVAYEAARKLAPRPELDLQIARCHERMSDWPNAIAAYTRYIETTPTPLDADTVLVHIGELRDKGPTPPPAVLQIELAPVAATPRPRGMFIGGAILGGVGLCGVGAGIGMGVAGDQAAGAATARGRAHLPYDPAQDQQIATDRIAQGVLLGVGAAMVVTGVILMAVGKRTPARFARLIAAPVRF